jgi:hypothetical protein
MKITIVALAISAGLAVTAHVAAQSLPAPWVQNVRGHAYTDGTHMYDLTCAWTPSDQQYHAAGLKLAHRPLTS